MDTNTNRPRPRPAPRNRYPNGSLEGGPFPRPPAGGYGVILADPPWDFEVRNKETGCKKHPNQHYRTENIDWIYGLNVAALAAPDAALFLWATWPMMPQALETINRWGFRYSALAWEWIKYNDDTGKFHYGTGFTTRKNVEPCLLATRGSPKVLDHSIRDLLFARRRENGRKPDSQYARCERLFKGPYVELFSRTTVPEWDAWGRDKGTWTLSEKPEMDVIPTFVKRMPIR